VAISYNYDINSFYRGLFLGPLIVLFSLFAVALIVLISIRYSNSITGRSYDSVYSNRDSALVGFSKYLCDSLSLQGADSAEQVSASLYLLKNFPTITEEKKFMINEITALNYNYEYRIFHLLPNSTIALSACLRNGSGMVLFVVKGTLNFERWKDSDHNNYEQKVIVDEYCSGNRSAKEINNSTLPGYQVSTEDWYYLIFENRFASSSVEFTINIIQVLYVASSGLVSGNCSVLLSSGKSCNLPIPLSSNYSKALLKLDPGPGFVVDWEAQHLIQVRCQARVWLVFVIPVAFGVTLLVLTMACGYFLCRRGHGKYSPVKPVDPGVEHAHLFVKSWEDADATLSKHRDYDTLPS